MGHGLSGCVMAWPIMRRHSRRVVRWAGGWADGWACQRVASQRDLGGWLTDWLGERARGGGSQGVWPSGEILRRTSDKDLPIK
eukprot:3315279-Lingulodinium_polyedra.AAC.1